MTNLLKLIEAEGHRNNALKKARDEGKPPSSDSPIDNDEFYRLHTNSNRFGFLVNLEILKSNHYLIQLADLYISECESKERVPELDLNSLRDLSRNYSEESKSITEMLIDIIDSGYGACY